MFSNNLNKTISILLVFIFILGLVPTSLFSQTNPSFQTGEIKGFNRSIFDTHFSRADREITPERWLAEAKSGIMQALGAWELIAGNLYDNPLLFDDAKNQIVQWSNEELERRFSQWLIGRFFGEAAEKAVLEFSQMLGENQKNYSWHLDEDGNILFDDKTGNPLVIRPDDYGREFSQDLSAWKIETDSLINIKTSFIENLLLNHYPELLTYIPAELRETFNETINESAALMKESIKREFENIAAREEMIFTSRRTRDIWSLRRRSDDEAARIFTQKLIAETEDSCKNGIEELTVRIEQAEAGIGDLAVMGDEWLRLYKEQFERGLKAWEEAEERFFIRRIEWEQDSFRLYSEGEEIWLSAFNQFEEQRRLWELQVKELFQSGEQLFSNITEELKKNIEAARIEFELNREMRIGEGTARVKALVDMYIICASAAISAMESLLFWQSQYGLNTVNPKDPEYYTWLKGEQNKNPDDFTLKEMEKTYNMYTSYIEKAIDARNRIMENYSELIGTGTLKDILSSEATSDDFCLDEYQIALIRAKALVLYWEKKTTIAEAVAAYANDLTAERITEAEGLRAWESAKAAYTESLLIYEAELTRLNSIGVNIQNQQDVLNKLTQDMLREETKLNQLTSDYTALISISVTNLENYYLMDFNRKYNELVIEYRLFQKSGNDSIYKNAHEYGLIYGILNKKENAERYLNILINGDGLNIISLETLENSVLEGLIPEVELKIRLAGIELFTFGYSSADWYSKVHEIDLSEDERAELYGEKLLDRLIADCNLSFELLSEKQLEYELLLEKQLEKDLSDDDVSLDDVSLSDESLSDESLGDLTLFDYELILEELENEYYFNVGLFEMYFLYSQYSSFVENEYWQDSCSSLAALFENYGITPATNFFPDAQEISKTIFNMPGDYIDNITKFLHEVDNCFKIIPQWLEYEIHIWKNAISRYISAYALYTGIYSEKNTISRPENETHWRQYLLDNYIVNPDPALSAAFSWEDGNLTDALFIADYHTNRVNDAFLLFSQKDFYNINDNMDLYSYLYFDEMMNIDLQYSSLNFQFNELAKVARAFEFTRIPPEEIQIQLAKYEEELREQEEVYNALRNTFFF